MGEDGRCCLVFIEKSTKIALLTQCRVALETLDTRPFSFVY